MIDKGTLLIRGAFKVIRLKMAFKVAKENKQLLQFLPNFSFYKTLSAIQQLGKSVLIVELVF